MIGPLYSPIIGAMLRDEERRRPRGWQALGSQFGGSPVDPEVARQARFRGLGQAGMALLSGAMSPNYGQTLANALGGFQGGIDQHLQESEEERRRRLLAELQAEQSREQILAARQRRRQQATTHDLTLKDREDTEQAMRRMVDTIEQMAGPEAPETRSARVILGGGPQRYGDLQALLSDVTQEADFPDDLSRQVEGERVAAEAAFNHPGERWRRRYREEQLALQRESTERGGEQITATSLNNALLRERERQIEMVILERYGSVALQSFKEFGRLPEGLSGAELEKEAEERALQVIKRHQKRVQALLENEEMGARGPTDDEIVAVIQQIEAIKGPFEPQDMFNKIMQQPGMTPERATRIVEKVRPDLEGKAFSQSTRIRIPER